MKTTGAITPSSMYLARRMAASIDPRKKSITVIEYGPGTGCVTKAILERLPADGRLIAIEIQEDLAQHLCDTYTDPRLQVLVADAAHTYDKLTQLGITHADYVVSSLPLGNIPPQIIDTILAGIHKLLGETGSYIQFQYIPWRLGAIKKFFTIEKMSFEIRNIPPAFVIVSTNKI